MSYYAEVILPFPLESTFNYRIPEELMSSVVPFARVVVPFGRKRYYTALVKALHEHGEEAPAYAMKEVISVLTPTPFVLPTQFAFWEWIASYYLSPLGDVYHAAVPSSLMLESQTVVTLRKEFEADSMLSDREQLIVSALSGSGGKTIGQIEEVTGEMHLLKSLTELVEKGVVAIYEEMKRGFIPRTESFLTLADEYQEEEAVLGVLESLKRAKQQTKLLYSYLEATDPFQPAGAKEISKKCLLERSGVQSSVLRSMVQRGLFRLYEKEVEPKNLGREEQLAIPSMSDRQQRGFDELQSTFTAKPVCLLTADGGRTPIYIHLIQEVLNKGRQVLFLLPEIILAAPVAAQLSTHFGDRLRLYHSGISEHTRVEIWLELLRSKEALVVLGTRSSLFLPFADLGLVIVDEEQEPSYKQQQPSPRYHARNAAVMLAHMHGAKTILGSATPSLESYYNVKRGKYGLVTLTSPQDSEAAPHVYLVNTKELRRKKIMKKGLFSPLLRESMQDALTRGEQIILFQNKRGFASLMECQSCGYVPHCKNCDLSLSYHKHNHRLVCHYCGFSMPLLVRCPKCNSDDVKLLGFGIEKVEEEVRALFPRARVERVDFDTAHTRKRYEGLIRRFEAGESDVLVGTQMIAKGLNFAHVGVVGVINADGLMNYPDFRSHERAFQLLVQVTRHARGEKKQGVVVIQTADTEQPILRMVKENDYEAMACSQLAERQLYRYPPYYRLIVVHMRSRDAALLHELSVDYAYQLSRALGVAVLGPIDPPVNKVQLFFLKQLVIKVDGSMSVEFVRSAINESYKEMHRHPSFKKIRIHYDVD